MLDEDKPNSGSDTIHYNSNSTDKDYVTEKGEKL